MWDAATGKCTIAGYDLAYRREGAGDPVLLIHGITTYSFIWRRIVPLLSADYDVIAVDLLGCGASDMPLDVEYSLAHHASLISPLIRELDVGPVHFVGHDVGGGIGQIVAVRQPELLRDLALINTVAYDFWPVQPITAMRTPIIRQLAMASLDLGTFRLTVRRGLHHKDRATPELMEQFWAPMRTTDGRKAFLHFAKCLNNQDLLSIEEQLRALTVPVLIVRGESDVYLSAAISERLGEEIPDSRLVRLSTAGHFAQEDAPEEIAAALRTFFGNGQT